MDTALLIRKKHDSDNPYSEVETAQLLSRSDLYSKLVSDPCKSNLSKVWRIIALSEIPGSDANEFTQKLISDIHRRMFTGNAFSLTKNDDGILPCYNAMIISALCKLSEVDKSISSSVDWILKFQPFNREMESSWCGASTKKYGGCYKSVPCYIGLVKSLAALIEYSNHVNDSAVEKRISDGMEYILNHQLFKRLSNGEPITRHILDLSFPASYHLNIVELLLLTKEAQTLGDPRTEDAISYIKSKRRADGTWRMSFAYKAQGYMTFDSRGQTAEWLTYLLDDIVKDYELKKQDSLKGKSKRIDIT